MPDFTTKKLYVLLFVNYWMVFLTWIIVVDTAGESNRVWPCAASAARAGPPPSAHGPGLVPAGAPLRRGSQRPVLPLGLQQPGRIRHHQSPALPGTNCSYYFSSNRL